MLLFSWNTYSTPLFIGFIQGSLYAGLLLYRAWREQRLSDALLAALILGLCLEIMDYMLGFAGVEVLWQELEFFPRDIGLLLGPISLAYLTSQINRGFRLKRRHLWHVLPFAVVSGYHLVVFAMGPGFVRQWEAQIHLPYHLNEVESLLELLSNVSYLWVCFRLYQRYRKWAPEHLSDEENASFAWFLNAIIALAVAISGSWLMTGIDSALNLTYWQDWWDELLLVGVIYYLTITGYQQSQMLKGLNYSEAEQIAPTSSHGSAPLEVLPEDPKVAVLRSYLDTAKPYLDPQLSLSELAERLGWAPAQLSSVMNGGMGQAFSEVINQYRVAEFQRRAKLPDAARLSLLGLALECGFNSKATFNRAFKKVVGLSPSEWIKA